MLFSSKEKGQGLVEYALILVFIALVVIVAVEIFGSTLNDTFEMINSQLGDL